MVLTLPITEISHSQVKNFNCGIDELNEYLKRYARSNHKKGIGKTFVLPMEKNVKGYYTISMGDIEFHHIPEKWRSSLPKYPIPVCRIGRLAIDSTMQGKGSGGQLLIDALHRIAEAAKTVAAYAVVVDAKNNQAKTFYEHYGFTSYQDESSSLFLPLSTFQLILS